MQGPQEFHYLVSVIVPMAEMRGKLQNFGTWILEINRQDIQVIIVRDGFDKITNEELFSIISRSKLKSIEVIEGEYRSPGAARNAGIEKAHGKWVTFWDSDDLPLLENTLEMITTAKSKKTILVGGFNLVNQNHKILKANIPKLKNIKTDLNLIAKSPGLWRFVFLRNRIGGIKFPNLSMAEDQIFILRARLDPDEIQFFDFVIYNYFKGIDSQLTSSRRAIADLEHAIPITLSEIRNQKPKMRIWASKFFLRQILTNIKYSSARFKTLYSIGKTILKLRSLDLLELHYPNKYKNRF